ncbi:MAG: hypothetical protein KatS3mg085_204 [Candidatus Dojkabacteria bacterium]|nr:MAG: hypothetical protein KatS3mg085_204 [Candidatus Dojkabacteria bacterium]
MNKLKDVFYIYPWILIILAGPIIHNSQNLPFGWELPKVYFVVALCLVMLLFYIFDSLTSNFKLSTKHAFILILVLYLIFVGFINQNQETILLGSNYRKQGIITISVILVTLTITSKYLYIYHKTIIWTFIISGLFQIPFVIENLNFILNSQSHFRKLLDGMYVFGSFGQSNFFAGHMLIGSLFSFYFVFFYKDLKLKILSILTLFILSLCIILSYSIWAILVLLFGMLVIFFYRYFRESMYTTAVASLLIFFSFNFVSINESLFKIFMNSPLGASFYSRFEYRKAFFEVYLNDFKLFLFGSGPDTLHIVLKANDKLPGIILDRTHDFFLDIAFVGGFILLAVFCLFWLKVSLKISKARRNNLIDVCFLIANLWILRSLIHTSSIINLVEFGILVAVCSHYAFTSSPPSQYPKDSKHFE